MARLTQLSDGSFLDRDDPGEACYVTGAPRISVTADEAMMLGELARGANVLEIGTGLGVSTRGMAATAKRLVTVDNDPWVHADVWPTLTKFDNVETSEAIPLHESFDMVFVDGSHDGDQIVRDLRGILPVCLPDTRVVFHDVKYKHVFDVVTKVCAKLKVIETAHGLGIATAGDIAV